MDTKYNPEQIEQPLYDHWEQSGYFKPHGDQNQPSYCIMIPPPNVTGSLHMGHAFQQTLMDILIRYHRMQGDNTLWQVGTDHSGIAAQMVVERKIEAEEGKTRHDYGRDAFLDKVWQWKEHSGGTITQQMRRLGASVDWDRERFTMDEGLSLAVKEVFIRLYKDGLIYRGKRLVNWDCKLQTAISDLEVENRDTKGSMWYLRYPLANGLTTAEGHNYLVVATTRPETMLGDVAVAVHPEDERYQSLIGQHVILPLVNRAVPIVADLHADKDKGTGCVKITPAHDFNDYEVGKRHQLPLINIFTLTGTVRHTAEIIDPKTQVITEASEPLPTELQAMERFAARKWIVAYFEAQGLLESIKPHDLVVPYSERGGVVVEPMLTDQWYVKVAPLAAPAIAAVEQGQIEFIPKQYENMYFSWMRDVQDWCISRQLWWGHRIPAWFDPEGNVYVGESEAAVRSEAGLAPDVVLKQDEDVLDTWFSSALWTFSTLGWPEQTDALKTFHPTNVLVTGFDIIFFWVARMIMMTMHFVKDDAGKPQVPFKQVYITGLIRDEEGQKMSKSKGNVIDPLDMIDGVDLASLLEKRTSNMMLPQLAEKIRKRTEKSFPAGIEAHGTDALRFTLTALASSGRDINWDMKRLEGYRNFCNKLWNASRFVLMNTENHPLAAAETIGTLRYSLADRWIKAQFNQTVQEFRQALDQYRFDLAANTLYDFIWNQFCDWYLELVKPVLNGSDNNALLAARYTLLTLLEQMLRLAHPVIPYITETIWQRVKQVLQIDAETIMLQAMPSYQLVAEDQAAIEQMEWLQQLIVAIRTLRAEMNIAPSKPLQLLVVCDNAVKLQSLQQNHSIISAIARLSSIEVVTKQSDLPLSVTKLIDEAELLVPMAGFIDKQAELARLQKEIDKLQQEIARIDTKLSNEGFVAKAPAVLIQKEQEKRQNYQADKLRLETQQQNIARLV